MNSFSTIDIWHIDQIINRDCIIYGAGKYGNILYSFLKVKGLSRYVIAFGVSSRKGNPDSIDGVPVKEAKELREELAGCMVFLAIGKTRIEEAARFLQGYGVNKPYGVTAEIVEKIPKEIFQKMKKLPLEQNKIFVSCHEGLGYGCNCKYIAEKLLQDNDPVKIVWAVSEGKGEDLPEQIKKVKIYTEEFYRELYTSRICITNSTINLFDEKKEGQYYINAWHGYGPFKRVQGSWIINQERLDEIRTINSKYDLFLTGSTFYSQVYRDSFLYDGEIGEWGAPRNDIFFVDNTAVKGSVYRQLSIPPEKKIVLYAPTFRTDIGNSFDRYDLDMPAVLEALHTRFREEFVLLYRFHHYLYAMGICQAYDGMGIDATCYPDIQELLAAADVVITDYSSLMWDFSLQKKPVFLYQNDEEGYRADRGFYCPVSQWPYPRAHSKEELVEVIENFDQETYVRDLNAFLEKYGSCDDGNASARVAERIMEVINKVAG